MANTANIRKVGVALDAIEVLQVIVGKVEVGDGGKRSIRAQAANVVADGLDPPGLGWVVVVSHLREAWHGDEHEANSARQGNALEVGHVSESGEAVKVILIKVDRLQLGHAVGDTPQRGQVVVRHVQRAAALVRARA